MDPCSDKHVHDALLQGFGNRPTVGFRAAAKLLNIHQKSLRNLVRSGRITFRVVGGGELRTRREFTLADLTGFYADAATRAAAGGPVVPVVRGRGPMPAAPRSGFLARLEGGNGGKR